MSREIEIKVRVSDSTKLVEFLNAEAEFTGEQRQVDEYFTPPDRDFTAVRPVNEWLRLRAETKLPTSEVNRAIDTSEVGNSSTRSFINYKLWHRDPVDGKSLYGDESESFIGDIAALREIFAALKFRKLCTVDKIRRTWRYEQFEIALDTEKTLGDFVEVELIGKTTKDVAKVRDEMLAFLHVHGITEPDADQVGYPYLLLFGELNKTS